MYLLPIVRTTNDCAHLGNDGETLCGAVLCFADESDYLCAFNLCSDCERIARGISSVNEWEQAPLFETNHEL